MATTNPRPLRAGTLVAFVAAVAFGVTAPLVKRAGAALGPFSTAALLYLGAALVALPSLGASGARDARLQRRDWPKVLGVALFGAAIAPSLLAWALQHTSAASASLLLNTEAVFTVLLARAVYREHIGPRVGLALLLMLVGGACLTRGDAHFSWGALAAAAAALGWGIDNTISRSLADRDPESVVLAKATLGALIALAAALFLGEPRPRLAAAAALVLIGATGYGASLRLYLLAQRRLGAARTGSIFAIGPFIGAVVAVGLGEPWPGARAWAAAGAFALGVWLHLTERHAHVHVHEPLEHEHAHRHDDGHHEHAHDPPVAGTHSHAHRHDRVEHEHEHAPDLHHQHEH